MNSDRQRLERTMDHLKLDKEHMEAENKELNNEILQKTEEFQTRKEELLLQRGLLQVKATHLNNYHGNASKLDQFREHLVKNPTLTRRIFNSLCLEKSSNKVFLVDILLFYLYCFTCRGKFQR